MKPTVTYPDVERAAVDLITALMADQDTTVGVGVPGDWRKDVSVPHLQVAWDATTLDHPVLAHATIRVTAWHHQPTAAKALADTAMGRVLAHVGHGLIRAVRPLTGLLPAYDHDTRAELASFTVRATVRAQEE